MLLLDPRIEAVWCENHDDVTLVWNIGGEDLFEFLQVKSNDKDKLWSTADICFRKKAKVGTSILEKSLAQDRADEACRFRIVTCSDVDGDLKVLTYALESTKRTGPCQELTDLGTEVMKRIRGFTSDNGNDGTFWLNWAVWDVWYSIDHVERMNLELLERYCEIHGSPLMQDQRREVYKRILDRAVEAATAEHDTDREKKRICRAHFVNWMKEVIEVTVRPGRTGKDAKIQEKMAAAGISPETIAMALEQRHYYRRRSMSAGYLELENREDIEATARHELVRLLNQLDAGDVPDDGTGFHERCLRRIEEILSRIAPNGEVTEAFLAGFMYETSGRCTYRFTRRSV